MKRICALVVGLALLAGCGAAVMEEPATEEHSTTQPVTTILSAFVDPERNPDVERFPCVASLPDYDIYLYWINGENYNGKMVLFQEERETIFDDWGYWHYPYPQLAYEDFDGDGEKEIAAITLVGSGTGLLVTDLHVLKVIREYVPYHETIAYEEFTFINEKVLRMIDKKRVIAA